MQLLDLVGVLLWREGRRREGKEGREGRKGRGAGGETREIGQLRHRHNFLNICMVNQSSDTYSFSPLFSSNVPNTCFPSLSPSNPHTHMHSPCRWSQSSQTLLTVTGQFPGTLQHERTVASSSVLDPVTIATPGQTRGEVLFRFPYNLRTCSHSLKVWAVMLLCQRGGVTFQQLFQDSRHSVTFQQLHLVLT